LSTIYWYINLRVGGNLKKTFLEAVKVTNNLLDDVLFLCEMRTKSTYFTRKNHKLSFKNTILFTLNFVRRSLQIELDAFFDIIESKNEPITKQGYSDARQKISSHAYKRLMDEVVQWYYDDDTFLKFRGYRLCAIDGSVIQLPNTTRLRERYGSVTNQRTKQLARAKVSAILDLENDIILSAKIMNYRVSERDAAKELITELTEMSRGNDLFIFDRGYPSRDMILFLEENGLKYLMRTQKGGTKEMLDAPGPDQHINLRLGGSLYPARVIRIQLSSGEEETLLTNLVDGELAGSDFKDLYFRRWGIEEKYKELKSRLQFENFTGTTVSSIEQDFYASIYLANMISLLRSEANQMIEKEDREKKLKYCYRANTNILIGKLKETMIVLLKEKDEKIREQIFKRLVESVKKNKTPLRPGRSYPRQLGLSVNKFFQNQKRCL